MKPYNLLHYMLLVGIFMLFTYLFNNYLQTDKVIVASLSGKYSNQIISNYLQQRSQWAWLAYCIVPLLILLRTTIIAFFMQMVVYFQHLNDDDEKLPSFGKYWSVVLFAEWVAIFMVMAKFLWFAYFQTNYSLEDLQNFNPLSLTNILDTKTMQVWLAYPINLISVWEFLYWLLLIIGVKDIFEKTAHPKTWGQSTIIIFLSYGVALLLWIVAVMYLILNISS